MPQSLRDRKNQEVLRQREDDSATGTTAPAPLNRRAKLCGAPALPLSATANVNRALGRILSKLTHVGGEKFWDRVTNEAVLQLRANTICDSQPLTDFWQSSQAQQIGTKPLSLLCLKNDNLGNAPSTDFGCRPTIYSELP